MELGSQGIVLLDFFDESVHLLKWDSTSPILIGTMVIGGLIIIVCKSMIINYVAWYAPKGRPINAFTMIDQIVQLMACLVFIIFTIAPLATQKPLDQILPESGCTIFWLATTANNLSLLCGGLTMALFRVVTIFQWQRPIRANLGYAKKLAVFLTLEVSLILIIDIALWVGKEYSGISPLMQFCKGRTGVMEVIIIKHQGISEETLELGLSVFKLSYLLCQLCPILELSCYIYLFWFQRNHNRTMNNALSEDEMRRRRYRNVINLSGQVMSFVLVTTFAILISLLNTDRFISPASYNCFLIGFLAGHGIVFIAASPELRRFYFEK